MMDMRIKLKNVLHGEIKERMGGAIFELHILFYLTSNTFNREPDEIVPSTIVTDRRLQPVNTHITF